MRTLLCSIVLAAMPLSVLAQNWTTEQLAVLEDMESCWNAWFAALESGAYEPYRSQCIASDDAVFFAGWDGGFWTPRDWSRYFTNKGFDTGRTHTWRSLRPLRIDIEDDIALVYYSPSWVMKDRDGTVGYPSQRRLEIQQKVDGKWKFRGAMGAMISED